MARALAGKLCPCQYENAFVEADIGEGSDSNAANRWRSFLTNDAAQPRMIRSENGTFELPRGPVSTLDDTGVSAPMVRNSLERLTQNFDVIVVSAGSLRDRLSSQFVLSAADVGVLELDPSEAKDAIHTQIDRLDGLPRNGSVAAGPARAALPLTGDDGTLAIETIEQIIDRKQ